MEHRYETVPLSKLKPDPEQPRKYFDEEALKAMVISIKNEGLINAIEVDEDYVIITGERRWRASKMAGLKEVPVKVLSNLSDKSRFIRQVQENIHQNTMSSWDTAEALDKVRNLVLTPTAGIKGKRGGFRHGNEGATELSKIFGISRQTISSYLDLLTETGEVKKALQTPGFQKTKLVSAKEVPEKYQKKFKEFIVRQPNATRDTIRNMAVALRRAGRYGEDDKAEKLLNQDFNDLDTFKALQKINKIIPNEEARIKEPSDALKIIGEKIVDFMEFLEEHPLESFDDFHRPLIESDIRRFGMYLAGYLGIKKSEIKSLEPKK